MKKLKQFKLRKFIPFTVLMGLAACNSTTQTSPSANTSIESSAQNPFIVATTSVICDLTEQIAGETVDLKCLVDAGVDPHLYQPTPEDRKAIDSAKLILYGGYNFDPALIKLVKATSNSASKIAVHEVAVPNPLLGEEHEHGEEEHEEEEGEKHAEGAKVPDPHVWHNAQNGIRMVEEIADSLEQLVPNNASVYQANADKITNELTKIDTWIKSQIATIPANKRKLVTTHDALGYYVNAYGLSFEGALEGLSTEAQPTAARVSELVKDIKKTGVPTIFTEITNNPKLMETVSREANVKISSKELFADGLGEKGTAGETYQKMLIANTEAIVEGLGGKYTPFDFNR
jgi:manganese/iron transport system substrate-binding protein